MSRFVNTLPGEMVMKNLFTFLTVYEACKSMRVCKQFHYWLLKSLETYFNRFEARKLRMDHISARALIRRMKGLQILVLHDVAPNVLSDCAQRVGAKLKILEGWNCVVTDLALFEISRVCLGLEKVSFSAPNNESMKITDSSLFHLATRSTCSLFLKDVSFYNAPQVTDRGLSLLLYNCPNLKAIRALRCGACSNLILPDKGEVDNGLAILDLSFCYELSNNNSGRDFGVPNISFLTCLKLSGATRINDNNLMDISLNCPLLEELSLSNCSGITDHGVEALSHLPKLYHLDLGRCPQLSDSSLVPIARQGNLLSLDVQGCLRLTDASLNALGGNCKGLRKVNFKGLNSITDEGMKFLCSGCPELNEILLSSCANLGDDTAKAIGKFCGKNLKKLDFFCVTRITDEGILELASCCPNVTHLNVSWCFRLTSDVLLCCSEEFWPKLVEFSSLGLSHDDSSVGSCTSPKHSDIGSPSLLPSRRVSKIQLDEDAFDDVDCGATRKRSRRRSVQRQDSSSSLKKAYDVNLTGSPRYKFLSLSEELEELNLLPSLTDSSQTIITTTKKEDTTTTTTTTTTVRTDVVDQIPHRRYGDKVRDHEREAEFASLFE